jgi:hypothetical protein
MWGRVPHRCTNLKEASLLKNFTTRELFASKTISFGRLQK